MPITKRILRVLKWTGIVLACVVAILLIINAVAVWVVNSKVEKRIAAIHEAGDPVSLSELKAADVPTKENAATYLNRAKSDAESLTKELMPVYDSLRERSEDLEEGVEIYPTDDELKTIESAYAAYPRIIPLLEQAARCPAYSGDFRPPESTDDFMEALIQNNSEKRMFARLLYGERFSLLLSKKQYDQAIQDAITQLKLSRLMEKDPGIVNFVVAGGVFRGIAFEHINEVLQSGHVSDELRQELEEELAKIDVFQPFIEALKVEQAFVNDRFVELKDEFGLFHIMVSREQPGALDEIKKIMDRASALRTESDWTSVLDAVPEPPASGPLTLMSVKTLNRYEEVTRRVATQTRIVRVINALGRRDNPDKAPLPDLSDLGLPKSVTTDPFSGKPLIVKKVDGGWLVYSVGENRTDDGGNIYGQPPLDIGLRPVVRVKVDPAKKE